MRRSSPTQAAARGFTLIELLVVLAILGILSVAVSFSLNRDDRRANSAEVQRLALLLEAATLETQAGARQLAWSAAADGYAFWENLEAREQRWQPVADDERFRARRFSQGLHIERVEIDGHVLPAGGLLVFRRGDPTLFRILIDTAAPGAVSAASTIELRGLASGRVEITTPGVSQEHAGLGAARPWGRS